MDNPPIITTTTRPTTPVVEKVILPRHSQKIPLIILGILEIPLPMMALYLLIPIIRLQNTLETDFILPFIGFGFFMTALLVALAQIVEGLFSFDLKPGQQITKSLIIAGLILGVLTLPAIIFFIITPIYSNLQTLK